MHDARGGDERSEDAPGGGGPRAPHRPVWDALRRAANAEGYALARALFLRLLGAVFAIAFVSLWVQAPGLFGARGIQPAAALITWARGALHGLDALHQLPTVFWLSPSDGALHAAFALGLAAALCAVAGVAQRSALFLCWALYLSFVCVGGVFLQYQWDMLLLEAGLLGVLFAPAGWTPRAAAAAPVNAAGLWLTRWLLFRLMLLSGAVKLLSGDPTWRNLTAFEYHYWTQPLPAWTSYYAAKLPGTVQQLSALATFAIELALPFLCFAPARLRALRLVAFGGFAALQGLIGLTGNYGFFNLLTLALCVPLLDDAFLRRWLPARALRLLAPEGGAPRARPGWQTRARLGVTLAVSGVIVWVSTGELLERVGWLRAVDPLRAAVSPLRSINSYGLFAVMTTDRPELEVEGSEDGATWKPYVFKWKPGPLTRRPSFVQPHMPRLDWQLWFAALGSCQQNPWFLQFLGGLLEGSPEVAALLEENPFPGAPPRYLRTTLWRYRFTTREQKAATGAWWARDTPAQYCPTVARREGG